MSKFTHRPLFFIALLMCSVISSFSQEAMPDVFREQTIQEQLNYIEAHTRVYENFRAIREDIFQKISKNTIDTLTKTQSKIRALMVTNKSLISKIDSLKTAQEASDKNLSEVTRTKESLNVLGMQVNKKTYNTVMWALIGILVLALLIGYLTFRQNRNTTIRTKKDLNDLKEEYEKYQKKTRLEREKMTIDHFNEIKKLKGS
jgi:hypothetical protein